MLKHILIAALCFSACSVGLRAATITSATGGTVGGISTTFWGQSITTPAGGPWDNLTINFFDPSGSPAAHGILYILTSSYTGSPSGLSAATPGFLAASASVVANQWVFNPSVTLAPNTQYFLYTDTSFAISAFYPASTYSGGQEYDATSATSNYRTAMGNLNFVVAGTAVVHPAFFSGEVLVGNGIYYLQFPDGTLFGYYGYLGSGWIYHVDLGYEYVSPGSGADVYLYDLQSTHWLYTSSAVFPYLYDFTLNAWLYYFPDTKNQGHYTTNPRYFVNLSNSQIFNM